MCDLKTWEEEKKRLELWLYHFVVGKGDALRWELELIAMLRSDWQHIAIEFALHASAVYHSWIRLHGTHACSWLLIDNWPASV